MKIFFAGSTSEKRNYDIYREILSQLEEANHEVLDSWIVQVLGDRNLGRARDVLLRQESLLREAQLMIVESSTPSFGIGYLMREAIRQHIPILCLYPEGYSDKDLSIVIAGNDSSLLRKESYREDNLRSVIEKNVRVANDNELVKFNFLANKEITEFLEDHAKALNKSKSEYLRDMLNEIIHNRGDDRKNDVQQ